ncbi:hypothetical protein M436DRAFT_84476 [Aureobasidium namibiae CBS 147.97]|uniref:Uncharacterized protein n=1 Tax=Aureobasidium namibiae CBS 147.97 TaxID=1043004 RepID=A0A074WBQ2_9PEZI
MHRFLSKKNGDAASSPLLPPTTSNKKWKKNKKDIVEEKPQLDLGSALPSIDDFRTSLIMPNLSTRFSMLREQDDPHSLLGKASDDSVLQPQRNSRLLDFGFSNKNLNDIAEVESINSSIRPPFTLDRTGSFASEEGYGTDNNSNPDGSVMTRSRPGEGNVLFGGRQKVYKIATGSAKSIGGNSERAMGGKMLYDDDMNMSAFQKYRQQERERLLAMGADWDSDSALQSPDTDPERRASDDLPKGLGLSGTETGFSFLKRNSDSTTNSVPSQDPSSSTATSVASQSIGTAISTPATVPKTSPNPTVPGLERSMTKRRLYEQGLNQHIQDQQASTMSRLNSINQRQRAPTLPSALNHSRSIGNLQDRRAYKPYALHNTTTSPQLRSGMAPLNTLVAKVASSTSSPTVSSYPQSPISPVIPETEEYQVLHSALERNDHGKATALGMFNKPAQQFDEQQYLKRQMQMGQPKSESPVDTPIKLSPVSQAETPKQVPAEQPPLSKLMSREGATSRQASAEHTPPDSRLARFDSARQNNFSRNSQRSRSRSISSRPGAIPTASAPEPPVNAALAVFQRAAMNNRVAHGDSPEQAAAATFDNQHFPQQQQRHNDIIDNNRTFFGDSDDEDEVEERPDYSRPASSASRYGANNQPPASQHPALRDDFITEEDEEEEEEEEEERRGFPFPEPSINVAFAQAGADEREDTDSPTIGVHEGLGGMISQHLRNRSDGSSIYPPNAIYADRASTISRNTYNYSDRRLSGNSSAWNIDELDNYYGEIPSRVTTNSTTAASQGQGLTPLPLKTNGSRPSTSDDNVESASWHPQHTRDTSTATQAEREAFANELEARRRAIQEKMKSIVESESRGPSPGPSASGALKAFGMLKARPSQETMNLRQTNGSRLGLGLSGAHPIERNPSYEDKISQSTNVGGAQWPLGPGSVMPSAKPQADSEIGRTPPQQARERSRNRSGSNASRARSRSRNRGEVGMAVGGAEDAPAIPGQRPSPEINSYRSPSTEGRGRLRSNSRAAGLHPSARPPMGPSPSQSPGSFNSIMSPPLGTASSGSRTPFSKQAPAVMPSIPLGKPRGETLRKKTINKFDISEPTLVSSTSNIDTVDLPPGASLKNGMDEVYAVEQAAVVSRRRKLFGFGREGSSDREKTPDSVSSPPMNGFTSPPMRSIVPSFGSQEPMGSRKPSAEAVSIYHQPLRTKQSFDTTHTTHTTQTAASNARFDAVGSPVLNEAGMF